MDVDQKRTNCITKYELGWSVLEILKSENISKATFYRWLEQFNKHGYRGLIKKSTKPKTIHYKLTANTVNKIIDIRKTNNLNEYGIQHILKQQDLDVGHTTIYNILKDKGLIRSLEEPRKQKTYIRFQRTHPNSLWQTDITNWNEKIVIAYIDDYSRFVTGVGEYTNALTTTVLSVFQTAIDAFGKPKQILTDHGTQYYNVRGGASEFDKFCGNRDIEHILGSIGKPTTTGKIERFFGTFKKQIDGFGSVDEFVKYYNYEKPHRSLEYQTPASLYLG